jgi:hypothetical protein
MQRLYSAAAVCESRVPYWAGEKRNPKWGAGFTRPGGGTHAPGCGASTGKVQLFCSEFCGECACGRLMGAQERNDVAHQMPSVGQRKCCAVEIGHKRWTAHTCIPVRTVLGPTAYQAPSIVGAFRTSCLVDPWLSAMAIPAKALGGRRNHVLQMPSRSVAATGSSPIRDSVSSRFGLKQNSPSRCMSPSAAVLSASGFCSIRRGTVQAWPSSAKAKPMMGAIKSMSQLSHCTQAWNASRSPTNCPARSRP